MYNKELVKGDGCGGVRRFKHRYSLVTNGWVSLGPVSDKFIQ